MNEEARKANQNLPGLGEVYNTVNLHLYHYAGNNPIKYVDPDGRKFVQYIMSFFQNDDKWTRKDYGKIPNETLGSDGCNLTAAVNNVNALTGSKITPEQANTLSYVDAKGNFDYKKFATDNGLAYERYNRSETEPENIGGVLNLFAASEKDAGVSIRVPYSNTSEGAHVVNVSGTKVFAGELWAKIDPTSLNDLKPESRTRSDWKFDGDDVYVKASSITSIQAVWKE